MINYTPGTWFVVDETIYANETPGAPWSICKVIGKAEGGCLNAVVDIETRVANARLMSLAPEMLEELQYISDYREPNRLFSILEKAKAGFIINE